LRYSSKGGNTLLYIRGTGFDAIPENNVVYIAGLSCTVDGKNIRNRKI